MAWWRIANGSSGGKYRPLESVRRDQMAAFLARYLFASHAAMPIDVPDAFPDDDDSVHESHINVLAAMGVIGGRTDGTFPPSGGETRRQMAPFRARPIPPPNPAPPAPHPHHLASQPRVVTPPQHNPNAHIRPITAT